MTFASTHEEYLWLTKQLFGESGQMAKEVWENCAPDFQEDMLEQLRIPLRQRFEQETRYQAIRQGDAW